MYVAAVRPEIHSVATEGAFGTQLMLIAHARRWISLVVSERLAELVPWWHVKFTLSLSRWVSQIRRRCRYAMLENVLPKLKGKSLLVIAGKRDTYVVTEVSVEMCRLAGQPDALWIVPNAKHNLARLVAAEEYDRRLVEFFSVLDPSGISRAPELGPATIPFSGLRTPNDSSLAAVQPATPLR